MAQSQLEKVLSGVAGEYFVAAELSRRGYIASITLRNTRGIDVLAAAADASHSVGIQVKTNQHAKRSWILTKKVEDVDAPNLFYVFVNLNGVSAQPSFHVVPSSVVARYCADSHKTWLSSRKRNGTPHKDTDIRQFEDRAGEYLDAWHLLGLDQ